MSGMPHCPGEGREEEGPPSDARSFRPRGRRSGRTPGETSPPPPPPPLVYPFSRGSRVPRCAYGIYPVLLLRSRNGVIARFAKNTGARAKVGARARGEKKTTDAALNEKRARDAGVGGGGRRSGAGKFPLGWSDKLGPPVWFVSTNFSSKATRTRGQWRPEPSRVRA